MQVNIIDFIEHFDKEEILSEDDQRRKYIIATDYDDMALEITLRLYEDSAYFRVGFLFNFNLENIKSIQCDTNKPGLIRFLFYVERKKLPFVVVQIKPFVSVSIDIEQEGII